jgi:hypothetical protein
MQRTYCDRCGEELTHVPPFQDTRSGGFCVEDVKTQKYNTYSNKWEDADLCTECIIKVISIDRILQSEEKEDGLSG